MKKKIISGISALKPYQTINTKTGEITQDTTDIRNLVNYVQTETELLYKTYFEQFTQDLENNENKIGSANSFGRKHGYQTNYKTLPREVKAKSRINELILHKFVTETLSYVNNPNPLKQAPTFNKKINLGAVDSQMAKLFLDNKILILQWKVWENEYDFYFQLPGYVLKKNILKISLPTVVLDVERKFVRSKASRLVGAISWQSASEIAKKLDSHPVQVLALEKLDWAVGPKDGSKWAFSQSQNAIEHSVARVGVSVKKVSAKNTSQLCYKCHKQVVHNDKKRSVFCADCKLVLDRDVNASLNIVKRVVKSYPDRYSRIGDNCSSTKEQVIESNISHKSVVKKQEIT